MMEVKEKDSEKALRQLYDKYRRPLCKFFYNFTYDYILAEDCVQEVFLRLWRSRKRYQPTGRFSTYLFQIGKNYWLNEKDKKDRRPNEYSMDAGGPTTKDGDELRGQYESDSPEPIHEMAKKEGESRVAEAIESLPEKLRVVFVMSQVRDMKYRDIGEVLGIPEGTVKSRMSRAVHALRDSLKSYFGENRGQERTGEEETGRSS